MKTHRIAVLPGDGIGAEVTSAAIAVLEAAGKAAGGPRLEWKEFSVGAGEYLRGGDPLPAATLREIGTFDAILLGAMGLPSVRWPSGVEMTPQLDLREKFDLYAGIRPVRLFHPSHSPLKGLAPGEIDFVIVREQCEGLFAGRSEPRPAGRDFETDTLRITQKGAERICRAAFELALKRRRQVTLVDKANVLPSMAFFRRVFEQVAAQFPSVRAERAYVDAVALHLVQHPQHFDVIVTENMFGDILSDLGAGLVGGMGLAPSADLGEGRGLFQPAHGTAPDLAGQGTANPVAAILSGAMMLDWLGGAEAARGARLIDAAVQDVLSDPARATPDLGGRLGTAEMTRLVIERLG